MINIHLIKNTVRK